MRKQTKAKGLKTVTANNPVAKFAHQFNKAHFFKDKRQYRRQAKHADLQPFLITSPVVIKNGCQAIAA